MQRENEKNMVCCCVGQATPDNEDNSAWKKIGSVTCQAKPDLRVTTTSAFTLIELLVVVLIIGILAAVAVPQYQKAVERAKATQAITLLKSLAQAYEVHHLNTGTWATQFDELDIDFTDWTGSTAFMTATDSKSNGDWSLGIQNANGYVLVYVGRISGKYKGIFFQMQYAYPGGSMVPQLRCAERTSAANFLFDSSLPEGAYCEKIMHATWVQTNQWNRIYNL